MKHSRAVILGLLAASVVIVAFEAVSLKFFSLAELTWVAFFLILTGFALGSALGGSVATRLNRKGGMKPALIVGTVLMVLGVVNLLAVPHPAWFVFLTTVSFLPLALLGHYLTKRKD